MRTVVLGKTGIAVSALGLGGIQFSKISKAETAAVIHTAIDLGVNFLETAHGYMDSEEKMGHALRGRRQGLVLASKNGARDGKTFTRRLEESPKRLKTDVIDIYQLHAVDSEESLQEALARGGAVEAGPAIMRLRFRRPSEASSLGLVPRGPSSGPLSQRLGRLRRPTAPWSSPISLINTEVPTGTMRLRFPGPSEASSLFVPRGAFSAPLSQRPGRLRRPAKPWSSQVRLALGYIYRYRGVVPVVGVETPRQVEQLVRVADSPRRTRLTREDFARIRQLRRTVGKTFCRACRYCEPCPQGISIFQVLYLPVYVRQMGARRMLAAGLPAAAGWRRPKAQPDCRRCESRCPFHLHIVDGLQEALALAHPPRRRKARAP